MSVTKLLREHFEEDEKAFKEIGTDIKIIKENHLAHMQASLEGLSRDIQWIKYFLGSVVLALIYMNLKGL
jgi:hypothetical protein